MIRFAFFSIFAIALLTGPVFSAGRLTDCSFIKDLKDPGNLRCGKLQVPENHSKPGGRKISIAYVVAPARQKPARSDALIYFSGGPGGGSLNAGFIRFLAGSPLTEHRDLVLFDQRGIQFSSPLPDIGKGVYEAMAADVDMEGERKMIAAVLAKYRKKAKAEGIDLGAYNSFQNARDAAALMESLGYRKYNLFGVSYGTRLARIIQDLFPDRINAVVLDSPNLMTDDFLIDRMKSYSDAAEKTFNACERDTKCSREHPDLRGEYKSTIEKLKKSPVKVAYEGGRFVINAQDAVYFLRRQLYRIDALERFPQILSALRKGEEKILRAAIAAELADVSDGSFNTSMFLAVSAFESMDPVNTPAEIDRKYAALRHFPAQLAFFTNLYIEGMEWHGSSIPVNERGFRMSSVPTMIFVNQYDPVTPPENGALFQKQLSRSHLFIIDQGGHGGGNFQCKMKMMTAFMDDPGAKPDPACLPLYKP